MAIDQMVDIATVATLAITAITGLVGMRRVGVVHKIVNQERTDRMNYQRALISALRQHDVEVPVDQSILEPPSTSDR